MTPQGSLTGWYVGLALGLAATFVAVVMVATILQLARRIAIQNRDIAATLAAIARHTDPIPRVSGINLDASSMNDGFARIRTLIKLRIL